MGSKARIAKDIVSIMLHDYKDGMHYYEPMVGGANVIIEIPGHIPRFGNDNNKFLIELLKNVSENKFGPEEIDKEFYSLVRDVYNGKETRFEHVMNINDFMIGWVGFMASANGRFFEGGYSGISKTKIGTERNYIQESIRGIRKQAPCLNGITFTHNDFTETRPEVKSIIYCDPPYKDTKQYSTSKNFNYNAFYEWCRSMSNKGHVVYISEYWMPDDFKCVKTWELKSSLSANGKIGGNKNSTEKLFNI